jgi:glutamate---cysteine ligase / carboxylate-amine ligase
MPARALQSFPRNRAAFSLRLLIEQRFGESTPFSVGVEEEVMILDAETLALAPEVELLIAESEKVELPGRLKTELFASVVELNTDICNSVGGAHDALHELRRAASRIAEENDLRIAAAGSHPFSDPEQQQIAADPRYKEFVGFAGVSARRQGVSGLHVHVGMSTAEACYATLEGILPWLPLVLALSANSPYMAGRATGLASNRAEVLAQLPRAGAPPAFGSYGAWESFVERLIGLGLADDYTRFWWDVRPHPRFGTLEIRMPDQPTSLAVTAALSALLQALCASVDVEQARPAERGDYAQNRWAALRFGTGAELIHPDGTRLVPAPELARELFELVGPAAEQLATTDELAALDPSTCEGERQLEIGEREGLKAVCANLVQRTLG